RLFLGGVTAPLAGRTSGPVVRMAVVGGGFGRTFHYHLHPSGRVTAVCDLRRERLELLRDAYRCDNMHRDYRALLKDPEVDAVFVATPAPFHAAMSIAALKAGKHVISAVPAGLSVAELEQLLETVRRTGLKYMMAETSRFRPEIL